jgi:hypothetical protein
VNVFRDVVSARRSLPATAAGPAIKNGPNRPAQRAARGVLDCPETEIWVLVVARFTSRKSAVRARHRPLKEEPAGSGDRRASIRARSDNLGAGKPSLSPNASSACALRKSCSGRPGLARIAGPRSIQGDSCKSIAFRLEHAARGDAQLTFGPFRACSGLSERSDGFPGEVDGGSELRVGS